MAEKLCILRKRGGGNSSALSFTNLNANYDDTTQKDVTIRGFAIGDLVLWIVRTEPSYTPTITGATIVQSFASVGSSYSTTIKTFLLRATATSIRVQIGYINGYSVLKISQ